jgi:Xaa-Pro aminopeptidase
MPVSETKPSDIKPSEAKPGTGPRIDAVRRLLDSEKLDCLLVSDGHNRRYLSGFTGSSGYLFITRAKAVLATDFRYIEQAGDQAPDFTIHRIGGRFDWLAPLLGELDAVRVGFESQDMSVATLSAIQSAVAEAKSAGAKPEFVPTSNLVIKLREVKDAAELKLVERASQIADRAFEAVAPGIAPGQTEAQVAWELEKTMRELGAEALSFDIIVGAGPNGALPHHRADETVIKNGDPVVIDMGCIYEGYCSDLTRTVFIGEPDERFRDVYNTVLRAQLHAEREVKAGMTGEETDALARAVIAEAGHGDHFGHSLGHGVGLEVHEHPWVGPRATNVLGNGMVFTVEPGIYISGWGGVRIEDMAVMEGGKARILSTASKLDF